MRYSAPGFLRNTFKLVRLGDLGTRTKNSKLGWFGPENRHFVLFNFYFNDVII